MNLIFLADCAQLVRCFAWTGTHTSCQHRATPPAGVTPITEHHVPDCIGLGVHGSLALENHTAILHMKVLCQCRHITVYACLSCGTTGEKQNAVCKSASFDANEPMRQNERHATGSGLHDQLESPPAELCQPSLRRCNAERRRIENAVLLHCKSFRSATLS